MEHDHDRVVLTRNGRLAAVLVSPDELEALEETLDLLSNPVAMEEIRQAREEIARGEVVDAAELRAIPRRVSQPGWQLVAAASAERSLQRLPPKVAAAVVEFMTGPLLENPQRVGRPLRRELAGLWAARRGVYRVVYELDPARQIVGSSGSTIEPTSIDRLALRRRRARERRRTPAPCLDGVSRCG